MATLTANLFVPPPPAAPSRRLSRNAHAMTQIPAKPASPAKSATIPDIDITIHSIAPRDHARMIHTSRRYPIKDEIANYRRVRGPSQTTST